MERENAKLRKMMPSKQQLQTDDFWKDIDARVAKNDIDFIKSLINDKTINMFDTNKEKQTLLLLSSKYGSYEITQLCLNLGCDINHMDKDNKTALNYAIDGHYYHIQQLLINNAFNKNHINKIKHLSTNINTQKFIINGLIKSLSIHKSNEKLFRIMFVDILENLIENKLPLSDDMLMIAWKFIENKHENPLESKLWKTIEKTIKDIVENGDPMDWYWFNKFIIPSKLWLKDMMKFTRDNTPESNNDHETKNDRESSGSPSIEYNDNHILKQSQKPCLYYKLLNMMVNIESQKQISNLEQNIALLANKNVSSWNELVQWQLEQEIKFDVRQDRVPDGLRSEYTVSQLTQYAVMTTTDFNVYQHYDYNQYLSKLILLAHSVDTDFHASIKHLFAIDPVTNIGCIKYDEIDESITYIRCKVPSISVAQQIADNKYYNEQYPITAKICDFNKCLLVFNDVSSLLHSLNLLVTRVRQNQCGNIFSIIRESNGFKRYLRTKGYASIKLSVLIQGPRSNIIGQIEFVLKEMMDFKNRIKHLEDIQKQKNFMDNSVSSILPQMLDQNKELLIAGNLGNVDTLYRLMSLNKCQDYLMTIDQATNESILLNICRLNHIEALKFVKQNVKNDLFVDRLFYTNRNNYNPIEALFDGSISIAMCDIIFNIKDVIQRYKTVTNQLFRLFITIYNCYNAKIVKYILSKLNLKTEEIIKLLEYKYPHPMDNLYNDNCFTFYDKRLSFMVLNTGQISAINEFMDIVGQEIFLNNVIFKSDLSNITPFEYCLYKTIDNNNYQIITHLLSFDIMQILINDMDSIYRIVFWMVNKKIDDRIFDFLVDKLELNQNDKLLKVLNYKPSKSKIGFTYHDKSIICVAIRANNVNICKKLIFILGDDAFINILFQVDNLNINSIEYAIWKSRLSTIEFIFGIKQIRDKILNDYDALFRIIFWLFHKYNKDKFQYIQNALNINDETLKQLLHYKSPKPTQKFSNKAKSYWDKSVTVICIHAGNIEKVKQLAKLDKNIFVQEVFHSNKNNLNPLEFCIKQKKFDLIKLILSMEEVKTILHKDQEALFRIMYWMFFKYDQLCFEFIMKQLELDEKVIISLLNYKAKKPNDILPTKNEQSKEEDKKDDNDDSKEVTDTPKITGGEKKQSQSKIKLNVNRVAYWAYNFVHASVSDSLEAVKKLIEYIGAELFVKKLLDRDQYNVNSLEFASVAEYDTLKFIFDLPNVVEMILKNEIMLYRLICHCCRYGIDDSYKLILDKCNIDDEKLKELIKFEYPRSEDDKFEDSKFKQTYYDKTLLSWAILGGKSHRINKLLPLCDPDNLMIYLLKTDGQGRKPFCHIVKKKKYSLALSLLKYVADTENQLKLISLASVELNDTLLVKRFEQMIIENQQQIIKRKESSSSQI